MLFYISSFHIASPTMTMQFSRKAEHCFDRKSQRHPSAVICLELLGMEQETPGKTLPYGDLEVKGVGPRLS